MDQDRVQLALGRQIAHPLEAGALQAARYGFTWTGLPPAGSRQLRLAHGDRLVLFRAGPAGTREAGARGHAKIVYCPRV